MREWVHARHLHVPALEAPAHVVRYSGIPCALCTYLAILRDARVVHLGPELTPAVFAAPERFRMACLATSLQVPALTALDALPPASASAAQDSAD